MNKVLEQVVSRLLCENAADLSDETIRRCLITTVGGERLLRLAIDARDAGEITAEHITKP